ncbi:MAG: RagB/SusD family nutrient uptake outer membrane protein [Prevotella sp.]|nr:RagB/SusD family nutrient uptake outer membrane protein [Prevotella sp.]MBR0276523.1 RagB/SusD family nutrient uptake outer membrane protein [Prevotella sp.]
MFGAQPVAFTQMNETQAVFAAYDDESYEYDPERDLREAAVMLPVAYPAAETGKATRGAAVGLLMKVLMLAEALNECGDREAALAELNKCKQQVNTINGGTRLYQPGSYGYVRDQIWQERRMEMAFEWDRYFDLVRQGRAPAVLHTFGRSRPNSRGLYFLKGVHERMPIPQNEIDMSNGVVEQNPGY